MAFDRKRSADYGHEWTKTRQQWAARHHPAHPCVRCGHPLGPMGSNLHLDHSDDRRSILGFSHGAPCLTCGVSCNVTAAARQGARVTNARRAAGRQRLGQRQTNGRPSGGCRFHTSCGGFHSRPWCQPCRGTADEPCVDDCRADPAPTWCRLLLAEP